MLSMKCPFCGKADIEYGLLLCTSCDAVIDYDVAERNTMEPDAANKNSEYQATMNSYSGNPLDFLGRLLAKRALDQSNKLLSEEAARANKRTDRRLTRGGTSIATFERRGRSAEVSVELPVTEVEKQDLYLISAGSSPVRTAQILCGMLKLKISEAKSMMDAAPVKLIDDVFPDEASALMNKLDAVGAKAELRTTIQH